MAEYEVGDRVSITLEGDIERSGDLVIRDAAPGFPVVRFPLDVYGEFITLIHRAPLKVGDIITPKNVDRLPEGFILVDMYGLPWGHKPHATTLREYEFKLIYIHQPSEQ